MIDQDDQDYNYLAKRFGYKCRYMRDPKQIKYLFEMYVPIVMSKGRQKIRNKANNLLKKRPTVKGKSTKNDYMAELRV